MEYGLIAERLGHSFSPEIHRRIGDYEYSLCELAPEALPAFLTSRAFRAVNVTIPYKQTVIPYLSHIDPAAKEIGAVNTVVNRDGELWGFNTDFEGMRALIGRIGVPLTGKKVLVLGTGGTSRTAACVAAALGAATVLRVSRTGKEGGLTYEEVYASHRDASYVINTTPVGMYPSPEAMPIDLAPFSHLAGVADAVYNPLRTELVLAARARGIPAEGGLYMLVAQAVAAARHFGTSEGGEALTRRIFEELRAEKENVLLIGMPGAGKTTVGRRLAERLARPFIDTDEEIRRYTGSEIPALFERYGEGGFRDIEAEVIKSLVSQHTGAVIATGGGAPLRWENCRRLRRNGRFYLLDRPLAAIRPTDDRPLARDREALARRLAEREPIYRSVADVTVPIREGDVTGAVCAVIEDLTRPHAWAPPKKETGETHDSRI